MDLLTMSLGVVSGICLGTGGIHLFIGLRRRGADMKHLAFALFAMAYGGAVFAGMLAYQATSLAQFLAADLWSGVFAGLTYIFLIWFAAIYTEVQPLPFLAVLTLTFGCLVAAHVARPTRIHGEIAGLVSATLPWGEQITFLDATDSIWGLLFMVAQLATIGFVFTACARQYLRGERRAALSLGAGLLLFVLALVVDFLVESGRLDFVLASDFGFLPLAVVMSLRISGDVIRTEEELADHREHLGVLVAERTVDLERANERLEDEVIERQRAAEALRQSYRTARALLNAPPDSALLVDPKGVILDINEIGALRLGWTVEEARGSNVYERFEPEVAAFRQTKVAQVIASRQPVRWEDVRLSRHMDNNLYPILDDSGQVASIAVFGADITEQRLAEEGQQAALAEALEATIALRESEARYRRLVEEIQEVIYAVDEQGVVTYASPAVERLMGYSVAEVVGRPFSDFVSDKDLARLADRFGRLISGAPSTHGQYRLVTKEGQIRWVQPSARPALDGERVVGLQGVLADVTDRVRAEEALRQRGEELAILNQVAQVLAGVADLPLALRQTSELINHLYDACFTFLILPNTGEVELEIRIGFERASGAFGPWPMGLTVEEMPASRQALAQGESHVLTDLASLPMPEPVREYLDVHGVLSVLLVPLLSRGEAIGILAVGADQDDQRFTPDQVRLAETLAGDVASAVENARLSEQAQALAVSQERERIARDLHDSVTQTIYSASLVAESLPHVWERNPGEARDALRALQQLMRGVLAELRTLLFELRADALEKADLDTLLHQLADVLTGRTRALVEVTIQGPTELPPEIKVALYRIAQEVLNNVAKHAHASEVSVTLQNLTDRVVLSVQDDGRGFDPASLSGPGLGMGIIRERAERIGATIEVDSAPGRGTRTIVIWPRAEG